MDSLFEPLRAAGLTSLRVQYDWRRDRVTLTAAREWEGVKWARYRRDFTWEDTLTVRGTVLSGEEVRTLYARHGLAEHLEAVVALLRAGRHERMEAWLSPERDIRFFNNVHSSVIGLDNGHHCIRSGGIRRHSAEEDELEVIVDGLNLARGMSFKNAVAGLPFGGCKSVVITPPVDLEDDEALGFIAYCIDRTRSYTGPDMGLDAELADVMNQCFSRNFGGGRGTKIGPSGRPTAYGVYLAIKEVAQWAWGSGDLGGRRIAVQGLGAVGRALAEYLLEEEAHLLVCDCVPAATQALLDEYPTAKGHQITVYDSAQVLSVEADIYAPCAVGGLLTAENIPRLPFQAVIGGANNVLRASSQEEEIALARLLAEHRILYQVEWVQNMGGVMSGIETYLRGEEASAERLMAAIAERVPRVTRHNLEVAAKEGITPTEVAYREIEKMIYPEKLWPPVKVV